jgi:hypothetical protein
MKAIATALAAPILALAGCATTGAYDEPYAEVWVDRIRPADPLVIPVVINRVDGVTAMHLDHAVVRPGPHKLTVDVPPRKGFRLATQAELTIDAAPCRRYYIAARLDTPVTQEWTPVVRSEETIPECARKFTGGA